MKARVDAADKVTGRALYADDLVAENMLFACPLHAAHAHARIRALDLSAARAVPGVVAVLTAADVRGEKRVGTIVADQEVIAGERVRYQGDVVAVVAGESEAAARAGVAAIRVAYEPLPALTDPRRARDPAAPRIHDDKPGNVIAAYRVRHNDPAPVFDTCARVIEREYRTSPVEHAYLEPESALAVPERDGSLTIRGSVQLPFNARRFVARACGLPLERVRVVQATLGGSFGGKDETANLVCARAALSALQTGRPVKTTYTREESMRESYKRHPFLVHAKLGVDRAGRMRALEIDVTGDGGPYCTSSPFVLWRPAVQCTGPYRVAAVRCDTRAVYTNNPLTGAMRGFGSPQFDFASESLVDEMAHACGLGPVEFRRRNFFTQGCTTHTGQRLDNHVVSIAAVLDAALERFGWNEKFARASRGRPDAGGRFHGVGLACSYRGVSLGAEGSDFCSAIVEIDAEGRAELQVSVSENGQGLKTAMTRIAAGELGIDPARIRFLDTDTSRIPDGGPTVASRGTLVGGNAVIAAARELKENARPLLAELLGAGDPREPLGYLWARDRISNPASGRTIAFAELAAAAALCGSPLRGFGSWTGPKVDWDEERGQGNAYFTYVYGCNLAEVSVSGKTGEVTVERLLGAHDPGRAIDPQMIRGQIYGGLVMGLGFALRERYPVEDGIGRAANFDRYRITRCDQVPELDALLVENPDPAGPWGAKSIGEPVNELAAPAIANAVFLATGVRIRSLPITAEAILQGLREGPAEEGPGPTEAEGPEPAVVERAGTPASVAAHPSGATVESYDLRVNGEMRRVRARPGTLLIDILRGELRLTGCKRGCGIGVCGTCTVLIDGRVRLACRVPVETIGSAAILTIEGLASPDGELHPIQAAFVEAGAIQCGFCTPGMVLAAKALLDRNPDPSESEIRRALRGNLCRCTGYRQIVSAVRLAAERMAGGAGGPPSASPS